MMDSERRVLETPTPPANQRVSYGPDANHFIDVRFPGGGGPWPGVLAVHGGFWRAKYDLIYFGHFCAALAEQGFVTFNIEYRRVGQPGGGWPGTLLDVAAAAEHVLTHAGDFQLDPHRLIVAGHSAGGQLALWLAGRHRVDPASAIAGTRMPFRAAVSLGGVADLQHVDVLRLGEDAVREFLGGGADDVPDRFAATSPASLLPLGVPQLIVHGEQDADVPIDNARRYIAAALAAGDDVASLLLAEIGHFEMVDPASAIWPDMVDEIRQLLESE